MERFVFDFNTLYATTNINPKKRQYKFFLPYNKKIRAYVFFISVNNEPMGYVAESPKNDTNKTWHKADLKEYVDWANLYNSGNLEWDTEKIISWIDNKLEGLF